MENKKVIEGFWIVGYGLGGGFGGIRNYEVINVDTEEEASEISWERACEEYDSYAGTNGLRGVSDIMEEDDIDNEDEAEEVYNEEREGWLDYLCMPFTRFDEERLSGYHFYNQYEDEISEIENEE